jgi:hypothetical protein
MSPRQPQPRPLHREPLVVALVLLNLSLGTLLLRKHYSTASRPGLPAGHPDVSVPEAMTREGDLPPGHPDVSGAGAADPAMSPDLAAIERAAGGAEPAPDFSVSGTVKLTSKLKEPWPAGAPVFVIARDPKGGPPFAARRYDGIKAPFKFSLGPDNVMLEGAAAPKRVVVSVRVDQDGDAMTRQIGDLEGGPSAPVAPGGSVDVTVDRPAALAR